MLTYLPLSFNTIAREEAQKEDLIYDQDYDSESDNEWEGEETEATWEGEGEAEEKDVKDESQAYMEFLSSEVSPSQSKMQHLKYSR